MEFAARWKAMLHKACISAHLASILALRFASTSAWKADKNRKDVLRCSLPCTSYIPNVVEVDVKDEKTLER